MTGGSGSTCGSVFAATGLVLVSGTDVFVVVVAFFATGATTLGAAAGVAGLEVSLNTYHMRAPTIATMTKPRIIFITVIASIPAGGEGGGGLATLSMATFVFVSIPVFHPPPRGTYLVPRGKRR